MEWAYRLVSWLYTRMFFGPRCDDFEPECCVCRAWKLHKEWFEEV